MDRIAKIEFLKGLQAGTRSITEILPGAIMHYMQTAEGKDEFIQMIDAGSGLKPIDNSKFFNTELLKEMHEKAILRNHFFVIHIVSDTPLAECEEDIFT